MGGQLTNYKRDTTQRLTLLADLQVNSEVVKLLDVWFPCFRTYSDTVLRQMLPDSTSSAMEKMVLLPEEAILEVRAFARS